MTPDELETAIEETCDMMRKVIGAAPNQLNDVVRFRELARLQTLSAAGRDQPLLKNSPVPMFGGSDERPIIYDDEKGFKLIARAQGGDADANAVLCQIAARFIVCSCVMPPNLSAFIVDRLYYVSAGEALPTRRGRKPHINFRRDFAIVRAIDDLTRRGFYATRNDATKATAKRESACSILVKALGQVNINMSEGAVEKVWTKHRDWIDAFSFS